MYINDKDLALNQILNKIRLLEDEISGMLVSYYTPVPLNLNGRIINMSLFELIQSIIYDYSNIVLKDFYEEVN